MHLIMSPVDGSDCNCVMYQALSYRDGMGSDGMELQIFEDFFFQFYLLFCLMWREQAENYDK